MLYIESEENMFLDDFKFMDNNYEFVSLEERQQKLLDKINSIPLNLHPGDIVKIKENEDYYVIEEVNYRTENLGVVDYAMKKLILLGDTYYSLDTLYFASRLDIEKVISNRDDTNMKVVRK